MPDQRTHKKEGTGVERVVLFFCALFFIVQVSYGISSTENPIQKKTTLNILPETVLALSALTDENNAVSSDGVNSTDSKLTHAFAPFFFHPVPINFCDKSSLLTIRGIGPVLAESILQTREDSGDFLKPDDLLRVDGIGPGRLKNLQSSFSFSQDHGYK